MPDRRQQRRPDLVSLAGSGELARFPFQPGSLKGQGQLVDEVVQQVELAGDDRPGAVIARQANRCEHSGIGPDRIEDPFGRIDRLGAASGGPSGFHRPGGGRNVARRHQHMIWLGRDDMGLGKILHQHGIAVEQPAKLAAGDPPDLLVAGA